MGKDSIRHLIAKARGGDRAALEKLLLEHYNRLLRHITPKLGGPLAGRVGADDILQETFIQAIRDVEKCQATNEASFFAWLKALADHRLLDAVKGHRRKKRGGDRRQVRTAATDDNSMAELVELISARGNTPDRSVARREAVQAVQVGIAALPADQQQAIVLHFQQGKSVEETATEMNRTPAAVRGLIHRGKANLADGMGRASMWFSGK